MNAEDWKHFLKEIAAAVEGKKDELSELDRNLGDGDHGVTMSIGWQAVLEKLNGELKDEQDCGKISMVAGRAFLSAVGSSVGPLYATAFMKGAKAIKGKSELSGDDLAEFWMAFVEGVKERGKAEVGDKTMVDTLEPAAKSLKKHYKETGDFSVAFAEAVIAGEKGMESTKDLVSQKGRSSRLGERSVGHVDPGAASSYLILSTFLEALKTKAAAK
ncbi:MAG TPA: dihydroxyacetone kinase subunit DhaL [Bacillales bacterium]|nr:dihydroxyacetone kinase subunit DhaL [Bacillales bacterium]